MNGSRSNRIIVGGVFLLFAYLAASCSRPPRAENRVPLFKTDFELFPCAGPSSEYRLSFDGELALDRRLLGANTANDALVTQAIREQVKYAAASLRFDAGARSLGDFYVSVIPESIERIQTRPGRYPLELAIDDVPHIDTIPYVASALQAGQTRSDDPAMLVSYHATLKAGACLKDPQGRLPAAVDLPADPYLAFWMVPKEGRRRIRYEKATQLTNPCADSELADLRFPSFYFYVWDPHRIGHDAENHSFACGTRLREGREFSARPLRWEKTPSRGFSTPLAELVSRPADPLHVSVFLGTYQPWTVPLDIAAIYSRLVRPGSDLSQTATAMLLDHSLPPAWDGGTRYLVDFLRQIRNVLIIDRESAVKGEHSILFSFDGRLWRSKRKVELRVFFGQTSEDARGGGAHWKELAKSLEQSDLVFYIGHSGMGHNLDLTTLADRTHYSLGGKRRPSYQLIGLITCRGFEEYIETWATALKNTRRTDLLAMTSAQGAVHRVPLAALSYLDRLSVGETARFDEMIEHSIPEDAIPVTQWVLKRLGQSPRRDRLR